MPYINHVPLFCLLASFCLLGACSNPPSTPNLISAGAPVQALARSQWVPALGDTWQWQLSGKLNTAYAATVYDIDLFDVSQNTIAELKSKGQRVVCYFSAGSVESWRPDFKRFASKDIGAALNGWAGERWLDTRSTAVRQIMIERLDLAKIKGCDGVEPDNVDAYMHRSGFKLDSHAQMDFNRFLAASAHARGLLVGLKNDLPNAAALMPYFDFAVNEQCFEYNECAVYSVFIDAGKPVFNAEYARRYQINTHGARDELCRKANLMRMQTLILSVDLDDSVRYSCSER
ncbi:endo alpha-1,4 polygalactosaminidase [Eoetvoesiella caeni]|uniref:Glycoside-hydrolase family GH114 TIM-barrel domain-containing protein n=1 Tax=Eoetvoesiella caeni TaxID=645616 RepID=A0A366H1H2_9BURK|nr:endo alpha-1,4 polygalactosaminidase [Eoetvoesiella caeni]MCI2810881.1 endo alpha-1,4 polygalactosaminidase [Eoetvoesiella caeni]NYT56820.1 endo alpha-1,4 polygalactosaminidase [Eoetvoesiella caeni]RBP35618.1 hypothetical protein DFR37_11655 [Eoetvoesiella caeni]